MDVDLFAGLPVADYARSVEWYARFLGSEPSFLPNPIEAVWELAEHRYVYIVERPQDAGHAVHTLFVKDLDALVSEITERHRARRARDVLQRRPQGDLSRSRRERDRPRRCPAAGRRVGGADD